MNAPLDQNNSALFRFGSISSASVVGIMNGNGLYRNAQMVFLNVIGRKMYGLLVTIILYGLRNIMGVIRERKSK